MESHPPVSKAKKKNLQINGSKRCNMSVKYSTATFSNTLKFTLKEVDPSTGDVEEDGIEDDYPVSFFLGVFLFVLCFFVC